tara:strand:+ start:263 stop:382 length:120 start_codon:yes stop_codon:yes gene_type:complete
MMKKIFYVIILILIISACGKKSDPEYKSIKYNNISIKII